VGLQESGGGTNNFRLNGEEKSNWYSLKSTATEDDPSARCTSRGRECAGERKKNRWGGGGKNFRTGVTCTMLKRNKNNRRRGSAVSTSPARRASREKGVGTIRNPPEGLSSSKKDHGSGKRYDGCSYQKKLEKRGHVKRRRRPPICGSAIIRLNGKRVIKKKGPSRTLSQGALYRIAKVGVSKKTSPQGRIESDSLGQLESSVRRALF